MLQLNGKALITTAEPRGKQGQPAPEGLGTQKSQNVEVFGASCAFRYAKQVKQMNSETVRFNFWPQYGNHVIDCLNQQEPGAFERSMKNLLLLQAV